MGSLISKFRMLACFKPHWPAFNFLFSPTGQGSSAKNKPGFPISWEQCLVDNPRLDQDSARKPQLVLTVVCCEVRKQPESRHSKSFIDCDPVKSCFLGILIGILDGFLLTDKAHVISQSAYAIPSVSKAVAKPRQHKSNPPLSL